jgi:hypothetical protein
MKDKEPKLEEIEASHTLGGAVIHSIRDKGKRKEKWEKEKKRKSTGKKSFDKRRK